MWEQSTKPPGTPGQRHTNPKETKTEKTKLFKKPKANPYKKHDDASDPEIEAFAKGELEKFHREKKEKAETKKVLTFIAWLMFHVGYTWVAGICIV